MNDVMNISDEEFEFMTEHLYQQAEAFHQVFDDRQPEQPTALNQEELMNRVGFILEELTELAVSHCQTEQSINQVFTEMTERLNSAKQKLLNKADNINLPIVQQADSLGDIIYLAFGSYVLMGVEPTHTLSAIHSANMHKLFPDGQPHRDPITNKVLKPQEWEAKYKPEPKISADIEQQVKYSHL